MKNFRVKKLFLPLLLLLTITLVVFSLRLLSPHHSYDIVIGVPSEDLQEEIAAILEDDEASYRLTTSRYSNIANPFVAEYQNCNNWVLNVIASAQSGIGDMEGVIDYYAGRGYRPSAVKINWLKGFVGSLLTANMTLDDHSSEEKRTRWFNFASAASLYEYLDQSGELILWDEVCHPAGCNIPLLELNSYDR